MNSNTKSSFHPPHSTRSTTNHWYFGPCLDHLPEIQLPTKSDVISVYLSYVLKNLVLKDVCNVMRKFSYAKKLFLWSLQSGTRLTLQLWIRETLNLT